MGYQFNKKPILIEQTAKVYKIHMTVGFLLIILGFVLAAIFAIQFMAVSLLGVIWFFTAKFAGWMANG